MSPIRSFRDAFDRDVTETQTAREREFPEEGYRSGTVEISTDQQYTDRLMRFFSATGEAIPVMVSDRMKHALTGAALLLIATAPAVGQGDLSVLTTIDPPAITIGDPVRVVVTVTHAPGLTGRLARTRSRPSRSSSSTCACSKGWPRGTTMQSSAELTLTAFELGDLTLPAFEVEVVDAAGDAVTLSTDAVSVTVQSVGRDESNEIRDIKGPLAIPFSFVSVLPWLAGVTGLGAIAYWLYPAVPGPRAAGARGARRAASAGTRARPTSHCRALETSELLELGEVKTYHIRVSDILRVYVDGRFAVEGDGDDDRRGPERTTRCRP